MQFVVGKFALDECLEGLYNSKQIGSLLYLIGVTSVLVIFFYSLFILRYQKNCVSLQLVYNHKLSRWKI